MDTIREATAVDLDLLAGIEAAADQRFVELFAADDWPGPESGFDRAAAPGFLLVAEHDGRVVGFAHVLEIDSHAHLEQVSVLPSQGGRGIGRALVETAKQRARAAGHRTLTLRTYLEVEWNMPFYARSGFVVSAPAGDPFLESLVRTEERLGLMTHGPRVQMTCDLV